MNINYQMKISNGKIDICSRAIFGSFRAGPNVLEIYTAPNPPSLNSCQVYSNGHMRIRRLHKKVVK